MLRGTFYLGISQFVLVITGFFLQFYLGRTLGPELYGIFGVINAFILINEMILMKGVYDTITKFVAEKEGAAQAITGVMVKAMAFAGLGLGAVYYLFAAPIAALMNDPGLAAYLKMFSFVIPFAALSTVYIGAMNGLRQFGKQALIFVTFYVVRVVVVIVLVYAGLAIKGVIIGLLTADILRLVMARLLYKPVGKAKAFDSGHMFRFALQLIIIAFLSSLVMHVDLLAVKTFIVKNLETGLYTAAATIAKIPTFMMMPVGIVLLPIISKSISDGDASLTEEKIGQSMKLLMMMALPISLLMIATSESCITLLYGDRYAEASNSMKILLLGGIFLSAKVLMYSVIVASGRPRFIIYLGMFSLCTEVILLIALTGRIGIAGAAIANAITHFSGFVISYCYVAKRFMTNAVPTSFIRIFLASFAVCAIAFFYSPSGILLLFYYTFLLCIFFAGLVMIKEINLNSLKLKFGQSFGKSEGWH